MARPLILVVEDDPAIVTGLTRSLEKEGFEYLHANNGKTGLELATRKPNLILLDIMLPEMDGLEVCREVRKFSEVPIIMVTAKNQEVDVVVGFELGADDYITKAFSVRELMARLKAVLRRTLAKEATEEETNVNQYSFGPVEVDLEAMSVSKGDKTHDLSTLEKEVLQMLLENQGKVISRNQFLNEIWGYEVYPTTRTIDFHISRLRSKIEEDPSHPKYILTAHGVGYKFVGEGN